ncbi:MAG TPA: glycosyltransferase [Patescibacteria group bacterium]|nr:glycosyltransferase [Patescibacteria group bacterium]
MNKFINIFDDEHIFRMTDDTGMFQHARFSVPNLQEGYTTDDNARALIMAVMLYEKLPKPAYLALIYRYLGFVLYAQNEKGRFRNFMLYNRQFRETEGSEDCLGRCLWALGYTQASAVLPSGIKEACLGAVNQALPNVRALTWPRSQAYALIGLSFIKSPAMDGLICELADSLCSRFEQYTGDDSWQWFEDSITYDNAVLPWALFAAYSRLQQQRLLCVASQSMSFLHSVTFKDGFFRSVGCNGWLIRGAEAALHDEQPLEACTTMLAYLAAYEATGDAAMFELARKSFAWYQGDNSRGESLIDHETGGCYDGIMCYGLNQNQGAESIVCYAIANLAMAKAENAINSSNKYSKAACCIEGGA